MGNPDVPVSYLGPLQCPQLGQQGEGMAISPYQG